MLKQLHINLDESVYYALQKLSQNTNQSVKDAVSNAVIEAVTRQTASKENPESTFTFIDLFGMMFWFSFAGDTYSCAEAGIRLDEYIVVFIIAQIVKYRLNNTVNLF